MQVSSVNFIGSKYAASEKKNSQNPINTSYENKGLSYPKGYIPYFGARLHRTPENFFSQEFNLQKMPDTVKKYLMSNLEVNKQKSPMTVQKEAFADLEMCESVEDVEEMFPDEPLFKGLKTLNTLRSPHGFLYELRYLCDKDNKNALKSGEDLTVYLLKKVYLEGKDLKEINEDFKKDVKESLLDPEHYPDGYFQYSTLKAIGINFPNQAYWKSLQATREDKEYIPYTITVDPNRIRKPREYKPRVISPEERQKRSERMINRWLEMSPEQRTKQIEKMRAGAVEGANNTLFEYLSPIMIIAAEKANLSDKMIEFFSKNSAIDECPDDLSNVSKSQDEKLKKFWEENPKTKDAFSKAIVDTIRLFDLAKNAGEKEVDDLMLFASAIKEANGLKALKRKMSAPEFLKQEIVDLLHKQNSFYPDSYIENYEKFLTSHKLFNSQIIPMYKRLVVDGDKNMEKPVQQTIEKVHNEFMKRNKKMVLASNIAVVYALNNYVKSSDLYTYSPGGIITIVHKLGFKDQMEQRKPEIEINAERYSRDLTPDELNKSVKGVTDGMQYILMHGYRTLVDSDVHQRKEELLPKVFKSVSKNKHERAKLKEILKDYTPYLRFILEPDVSRELRTYMLESLIDECLINFNLTK